MCQALFVLKLAIRYTSICACVHVCGCLQLLYDRKKEAKKSPFLNVSPDEKQNVCMIQLLFKYANEAAEAGSGLVGSPDDSYKRGGNKAWRRKLVSCSFSPFFSEFCPACTCSGTIKLLQLKLPHHCHGFCLLPRIPMERHGGAGVSNVTSQQEGRGFDPPGGFLHVPARFSGFLLQ